MKKSLFITLSAVALVGLTVTAYNAAADGWSWYSKDGKTSRPVSGLKPAHDCLEMPCENGCVENGQAGYCCPEKGKCSVSNGADVDLCCEDDEYCNGGTCRKKFCKFGGASYNDYGSVGECGKCMDGVVILDTSKAAPTCKTTCNTKTWKWDNVADETKLDACHVCRDGQGVTLEDGTRVNHCYECKNGTQVMVANGTTTGDCGKCVTSQVTTWCPFDPRYRSRCHYATVISASRDTSKPDPLCQTCNTTTWLWDNKADGTRLNDCRACQDGNLVISPANENIQCCEKSSDCDLHSYCSDNKCVPCNKDGTGVRPSADAEYCDCPDGFTKYCGSTRTTTNCKDGGSWTCKSGCHDNTDCPVDQQCSCNGKSCSSAGGKCLPCPAGTHRAATAATQCLPCSSCEQWNETTQACESMCESGQLCVQATGGASKPNTCGGDYCLTMPDRDELIHKTGSINGRSFYISPAQTKYRLTHTSASRFCEYYGMHLATVTEACVKDYYYDTGNDCPNFVSIKTFGDRGISYNLNSWHVEDMGAFWLANMSGNEALRVTDTCGNNHSSNICNGFYPLCTTN